MRLINRRPILGILLVLLTAERVTPCLARDPMEYRFSDLMRELAQVRSASGAFDETRQSKLLIAPVKSAGSLQYRASDYLRKTTTSPELQDFVLQGNQVTLNMQGRTRHFSINQAPQISGLVDGLRATLAGNGAKLKSLYEIHLSGTHALWQLLLVPRDEGLRHMLAWLSISGAGSNITQIDTASPSGETTQMSVRESVTLAP